MLRTLRQAVVAPVLRVHADRLLPAPLRRRVPALEHVARLSSWWRGARGAAPLLPTREDVYALVLERHRPRTYLELGVAGGRSLRWWSERLDDPDARLVGFDTFEGLPEAWGRQGVGSYTAGGALPDLPDPRVELVVGRFEDTLQRFFDERPLTRPLVVHLDADLYSSTAVALRALGPRLEAGDVLVFDELLDVGTADHELAAFLDVSEELGLAVEVLAAVRRGPQVAVRVRP